MFGYADGLSPRRLPVESAEPHFTIYPAEYIDLDIPCLRAHLAPSIGAAPGIILAISDEI
jgi:hypothetical protein